MAKLDPRQVIQKRRTEEEMLAALAAFVAGKPQVSKPQEDDDTEIVIRDCIRELVLSRLYLEDARNFMQIWLSKFPKRQL